MRSNSDVIFDGGLNLGSKETSVMGEERRFGVIQLEQPFTTSVRGRKIMEVASIGIPITKQMVWESYKKGNCSAKMVPTLFRYWTANVCLSVCDEALFLMPNHLIISLTIC